MKIAQQKCVLSDVVWSWKMKASCQLSGLEVDFDGLLVFEKLMYHFAVLESYQS